MKVHPKEPSRRHIVDHPAILLAIPWAVVHGAAILVDSLPFYDFCSVSHETGFVPPGFVSGLIMLLLLGGWAGVDRFRMVRGGGRNHPLGSTVALLAYLLILAAAAKLGAQLDKMAVERFTQRMEPTVAAIEAHVDRYGVAPDQVTTLPAVDMCAEELRYEREGAEWSLRLVLVDSSLEGEWVQYPLSDGHYHRRTVVNGWGWSHWLD